MSVTGIITEYNPFHNGHLYHLKKTKEVTDSQPVIAVMSGNFTQRGQAACFDKWSRAKMACLAGVDLVLELPLASAIRSAEHFAQGAIKTLAATGVVSDIVFGSEAGELAFLKKIAKLLAREPEKYKELLHLYLKKGYSYPKAHSQALSKYFTKEEELLNTIMSPNNILGIEYLKAIYKDNLDITAHTIPRKEANYHDRFPGNGKIASATAIRKILYQYNNSKKMPLKAKKYLPDFSWEIIVQQIKQGQGPARLRLFQDLLTFTVSRATRQELNPPAFNDDLVNSLLKARQQKQSFTNIINCLTSPSYPRNRISRGLVQLLCRLTQKRQQSISINFPSYLRVLALGRQGEELLSRLSEKAELPLIVKPSDYLSQPDLTTDNPLKLHLSLELIATDIYNNLRPDKKTRKNGEDFTRRLITIN